MLVDRILKLSISLFLVVSVFVSEAQELSTTGSKSPIIKGVRARIKYQSNVEKNVNIPDELIPYLSGLLVINNVKSEETSINAAVDAWVQKYEQLAKRINEISDPTNRQQAQNLLQNGKFDDLEKLLNPIKENTDYDLLKKIFPRTYIQTSGDQSPIVVGDFASITYVVKKVIQYNLPEGLTVNLLAQLQQNDRTIESLQNQVLANDKVIEVWISRYKKLEIELKNRPGNISEKAYEYFVQGELDKASKELEKASSDAKSIGEVKFLQARIMLLELTANNADQIVDDVEKYFEAAASLNNTFEVSYEFGKFLTDYKSLYLKAEPYFLQSLKLSNSKGDSAEIYNYLGMSASYYNKGRSVGFYEAGLNLIGNSEELFNSKFLILMNLGSLYANGGQLREGIDYTLQAQSLIDKMSLEPEELKSREAALYGSLGVYYGYARELDSAERNLTLGINGFKELFEYNSLIYITPMVRLSISLAELYFNGGRMSSAEKTLRDAMEVLRPVAKPGSKTFYLLMIQANTALLQVYKRQNRPFDALSALEKLNDINDRFTANYCDIVYETRGMIGQEKGSIYASIRNADQALKHYDSAYHNYRKVLANNPSQYAERIATVTSQRAGLYVILNQRDKAVKVLKEDIKEMNQRAKINPNAFTIHVLNLTNQLGTVFSQANDQDSAIYYFSKTVKRSDQLVRQNPQYLQVYSNSTSSLNLAYRMSNRKSEAVEVFKDYQDNIILLTSLNPTLKNQYAGLIGMNLTFYGDTFMEVEDYENAEVEYKMALEYFALVVPENVMGAQWNCLVHQRMAVLYKQLFLVSKDEDYEMKKCQFAKKAVDNHNSLPPSIRANVNIIGAQSISNECNSQD